MMRASHVHAAATRHDGEAWPMRIGQAAREVGVSASALRLWERQGLVRPARSSSGYRLFSQADVARLVQVRRMREQNVNAHGIRRILADGQHGRSAGARPPRHSTVAGARLRQLRRAQSLSLREAGRRAGVSPSFLSALERDAAGASLGTIRRLTNVYGVTMLDLFGRNPDGERVVRRRSRRVLELTQAGVRIEQLAEVAELLEPQLFTLAGGADSAAAYSHDGEEFLFVLDGELTFWVGTDERYRLRTGDALTFPSNLPHRWRNRAGGETRLLWINTPPTF